MISDQSLISNAKSNFTLLLQSNKLKLGSSTVSVISTIVETVEFTFIQLKKNKGITLTSKQKLDLAFDIAEFCVEKLADNALISQDLKNKVLADIGNTQVFADITADVVMFLYEHKVCCGCGPKATTKK